MLKKSVMKSTALLLGIIYILSFISVISGATSIGTTLYETTVDIAGNAIFKKIIAWHPENQRQEANVITYTPSKEGVRPLITYGSKIYGRSNINQAIEYATTNEDKYIIGGINGDFYSLQTGVPLGMVVHGSKLISSDDSYPAIGFKSDGSCIIGNPSLSISMKTNSGTVMIDYFNKYRTSYGLYLFSEDFSAESRTDGLGTHIMLEIISGKPGIGQTVETKVVDIMTNAGNIAMKPNTLLLSVDNNGPLDKIKDLALNQHVFITFRASDEQWNQVVEAVGGGGIIVQNGVSVPYLDTSIAGLHPRTAIGVKANGDVVMAQVDGRKQYHSAGANFNDLSEFMIAQGCVTALNLDGGGSSTTAVRMPGEMSLSVVNKPSDNSLRANANFILLENTAYRSNAIAKLQIYPYNINILPNTKIELNAKAMDSSYYAISISSTVGLSFSVDNTKMGTVEKAADTGKWSFTSSSTTGNTTIKAKAGPGNGTTTVTVIDKIDDMSVYEKGTTNVVESIDVGSGGNYSFDVAAFLNTQQVYAQTESFKWEILDEGLGTITSAGIFTAAQGKGLKGKIKVSYGELSKIIDVIVGRDAQIIYDFEKATGSFNTSYNGTTPKVEINTDKEFIKYGVGSLLFEYKLQETATAGTNTSQTVSEKQNEIFASLDAAVAKTIEGKPSHINLWVYGDNSNNSIYAVVTDSKNNEIKIPYDSNLNFSGWKLVSATIDTQNYPIKLKTPFGINNTGENKEGKVFIDQLSVTYETKLNDTIGPVIEISDLSKWDKNSDALNISAVIKDDMGAAVQSDNITVKIDGRDVDFEYIQNTGILNLSVKNSFTPGFHKIAIKAKDNVGNISYKYETIDFAAGGVNTIFTDTKGHWANKYIDYIYNEAIVQGTIDDKSGERYFYPDTDITRAEFAIMLCRYLRLDTSLYLDTKLPFTDASKIKDWALPHIKAVYATGIMNGKPSADGRVVFDPTAKLTRAEIITAIGKLFEKGYKEGEVNFTDAQDIGTWAYPYVKMLTGMGVVNGYSNGTLMPGNSVKRSEVAKIFYSIY